MCQTVCARASSAANQAARSNVERGRKKRKKGEEEPSTVLDTHLSSEEHHLSATQGRGK